MTTPDCAPSEVVPLSAADQSARIVIRPFTPSDVRAVRRLERAAYGSANPRTAFERELHNGLAAYLVAVDAAADGASPARRRWKDRGAVGWLRRRLGAGEAAPILGFAGVWYTHEQLHLVTIAVDPRQQRRGIGLTLLLATCDLAIEAELDSIALEVRASNAGAMRLYERCGFRRAGRLRNYYSDNREDAIVMLLDGLTAAPPPQALTLARCGRDAASRTVGEGD